ncbi:exopolysaccharide biosynthesis protein [Shimia ponticola]|uniref:exopolysaccharide biosynthesis protein n=1 Tax=Shimia ponticola TaxID=2582893 RepID=UPI0011BDBD40|nr:exopolysaccharide biosynthesis protein [Shimia ponticola]
MTFETSAEMAISERLNQLANEAPDNKVTLFWVMDQLHERAFGLFLLILALPCCIPFLYAIPQIVALPLMVVSGQILFGRSTPWLPQKLGNREVRKDALQNLADRARPWLTRIEAISHPRLTALTRSPMDRFVGLALVLFSASILVPLPATNTVPGFAVVVVSMGLLQRDGVLVILGGLLGTAWIASLIFAGATLVSLLKGWLGM